MRLVIPVLGGLGLALLVSGLPLFDPRRLSSRVDPYLNGLGGRPSGLVDAVARTGPRRQRMQETAARLFPLDRESVHHRLLAAGQDQPPEEFRLDQLLWAAGGGCSAVVIGVAGSVAGEGPTLPSIVVLGGFAAAAGWAARDRQLTRAIARRREVIRNELPLALDLLTLSIMAGEAVPQAFARVGRMLGGEVGREFDHIVGSVRAGSPIVEALSELPPRLPEAGTARLVDALCTGIERGAPLAETLRAQADDLRQATRRELLESGGRREILMLVPVVFLILPTVVAFTLLPGLVSLDLLVP